MAKAGSQRQGNLAFKENTVVRMIFNKSLYLKPNRNKDFSKGGHSFDSAVLFFASFFCTSKRKKRSKRGCVRSQSGSDQLQLTHAVGR